MEVNKKPWPIATVCGTKDRVDTNPDFRRPAVWSRPQTSGALSSATRQRRSR